MMLTIQQEIESEFANKLAARYRERYEQALDDMKAAYNNGDMGKYKELDEEIDSIADLFDDYKTECGKLGIEITVELGNKV